MIGTVKFVEILHAVRYDIQDTGLLLSNNILPIG